MFTIQINLSLVQQSYLVDRLRLHMYTLYIGIQYTLLSPMIKISQKLQDFDTTLHFS